MEVQPPGGLYDERAKLSAGKVPYICPASVSSRAEDAYTRAILTMCRALDIRGLARFDFVLDDTDEVHLLESNTIPGLSREAIS